MVFTIPLLPPASRRVADVLTKYLDPPRLELQKQDRSLISHHPFSLNLKPRKIWATFKSGAYVIPNEANFSGCPGLSESSGGDKRAGEKLGLGRLTAGGQEQR